MKKIHFLQTTLLFFLIIFLSSCDENGGDDISKQTGVLITNAGNFGKGNGTLSFYDEEAKTISNDIINTANSGASLGSLVESVYLHDGMLYIICNATDKIEFISADNYKFLDNPVTNLNTPRYMAIVGSKAYITCYGSFDANYFLPDSYVAVMDIASRKIIDSLKCGAGPEGIIALNNMIYVANSYENSVSVIDFTSGTETKIALDAAPQHFVLDGTGKLHVTVSSYYGTYPEEKVGLQSINTAQNKADTFVKVTAMSDDGIVVANGDGSKLFLLTAEPYPGTATKVLVYDVASKTVSGDALISGENFYGLGYNVSTDRLYVSDAAGFSGNGKIMAYDAAGVKLDEQTTSIGPYQFIFK